MPRISAITAPPEAPTTQAQRRGRGTALALTAGLALLALAACTPSAPSGWDARAAAGYLDARAAQWLAWRPAAREGHTVCMSCHTSLPYALARDTLGRRLGESRDPDAEQRLLASVVARVRAGPALPPYYRSQPLAARGTEAVLNALILLDARTRRDDLEGPAEAALEALWGTQLTAGPEAGSWPWIGFGNEPWEATDSAYYGATLAARALGYTTAEYRARPGIAARVRALHDYLQGAYPRQNLLHRADLLWAAARLPGLLDPPTEASIVRELSARQRADGGWSLGALAPDWRRHDGRALPDPSDGYATGFVALVLEEGGIRLPDPRLRRARAWLEANQSRWNGRWSAPSPNRTHWWGDETGRFMDDAATAFAVLALARPTGPGAAGADAGRPGAVAQR